MAVLSEQQERILTIWADTYPAETEAWTRRMVEAFGPDEPEELIRKFQIFFPAAWVELMTALTAAFSATTADVEREVGRRTIAASGVGPRPVQQAGSSQAAVDALNKQREDIYAQARADIEAEVKAEQRADLDAVQRKNTIDAVVKRLKAEHNRRAAFDFGAPFVRPVETDAELAAFVERLRGNLERLGYKYRARDLPALLIGWMDLAASRGAKYRVDSALINETALYDVIQREVNK